MPMSKHTPSPTPPPSPTLSQALRDEYPSLYLISACVGPFGTGDTPLQHYNSALALHHLQVFADAVIYRGNDDLLQESLASARKGLSHSNAIGGGSCSGHGVGDWGGRGGGNAGRWRPVGLLSRGNIGSGSSTSSSSRAVNTIGGFAARAGGVSMTDMNASLSLDVASLFFPTSPPPPVKHTDDFSSIDVLGHSLGGGGGFRPGPPRPAPGEHYRHHRREVTAPRPFDGGCLMSAACPLPGAKFVDLRSTLSFGLGHRSARELSQDRPVKLTDERRWGAGGSEEARARGAGGRFGWAALAGGLGKVAPLCPRRAGGSREGDACVAAYHVVRGVDIDEGPAATAATVAAAAVSAAAGEASEALRGHHECSEWRTATDASCSPGVSPERGRGGNGCCPCVFFHACCARLLFVLVVRAPLCGAIGGNDRPTAHSPGAGADKSKGGHERPLSLCSTTFSLVAPTFLRQRRARESFEEPATRRAFARRAIRRCGLLA